MDFHQMKRRQLQELCKKHGVPANKTNVEMANRLTSILKEKEQPLFRGKSCLKNVFDVTSDDSKDMARKVKKVRFSPQEEMIEFVDLENNSDSRNARAKAREIRKRAILKPVLKEAGQAIKKNVNTQFSEGVGEDWIRMTRSRKSMVGDVVVDLSSPHVQKKGRRNVKSRSRGLDDVAELDDSIDFRADGMSESIGSCGENIEEKGGSFHDGRVLRRSMRNETKVKNLVVLSGESGHVGFARRIARSRTQLVEQEASDIEFGRGTAIDTGFEVQGECEQVLRLEERTRGLGRKASRQKSAITQYAKVRNDEHKKISGKSVGKKGMEIEVEKNSLPNCTLRRSRRNTTLFKSSASVIVGSETNEDVRKINPLKELREPLPFEQTSAGIEFPRRSTSNISKHDDSSVISSGLDVIVNANRRNQTRKRRREPVLEEETMVIECELPPKVLPRLSTRHDSIADATLFGKTSGENLPENIATVSISEVEEIQIPLFVHTKEVGNDSKKGRLGSGRKSNSKKQKSDKLPPNRLAESILEVEETPLLMLSHSNEVCSGSKKGEKGSKRKPSPEKQTGLLEVCPLISEVEEIGMEGTQSQKSVKLLGVNTEQEMQFSIRETVVAPEKETISMDKEKECFPPNGTDEGNDAQVWQSHEGREDVDNFNLDKEETVEIEANFWNVVTSEVTSPGDDFSALHGSDCVGIPAYLLESGNKLENIEDSSAAKKKQPIIGLQDCHGDEDSNGSVHRENSADLNEGIGSLPELVIEYHVGECNGSGGPKKNCESASGEAHDMLNPSDKVGTPMMPLERVTNDDQCFGEAAGRQETLSACHASTARIVSEMITEIQFTSLLDSGEALEKIEDLPAAEHTHSRIDSGVCHGGDYDNGSVREKQYQADSMEQTGSPPELVLEHYASECKESEDSEKSCENASKESKKTLYVTDRTGTPMISSERVGNEDQYVEDAGMQETASAGHASTSRLVSEMVTEFEFNTRDNSTIIETPLNAIIDPEHQGISGCSVKTCSSGLAVEIDNDAQEQEKNQMKLDTIDQSTMLEIERSDKHSVEGEESFSYDTQTPNDIMCRDEMFGTNYWDGSQERTNNDVTGNRNEPEETPYVRRSTPAVGTGFTCLGDKVDDAEPSVLHTDGQIFINQEGGGTEKNFHNVTEEVMKKSMHELSNGKAADIIEDNVHKQEEDPPFASIQLTPTSSIEKEEILSPAAEMMGKIVSSGEALSITVGSSSLKEGLEEDDNKLISNIESTSPIISTQITDDGLVGKSGMGIMDAEDRLYSAFDDSYEDVHAEHKESEVLEINHEKASAVGRLEMFRHSVDENATPLLSQERGYHGAQTVEETCEVHAIVGNSSELPAKAATVKNTDVECLKISQCSRVAPSLTLIHFPEYHGFHAGYQNMSSFKYGLSMVDHISGQERDELEVQASDTISRENKAASLHETNCQVLDESTDEGSYKEADAAEERIKSTSKEKFLQHELEEETLNERVGESLSQTAFKVLVGGNVVENANASSLLDEVICHHFFEDGTAERTEKIKVAFSPEIVSMNLNDHKEELVESNCSEDTVKEATPRNSDVTYEVNTEKECIKRDCDIQLCDDVVTEGNAGFCPAAELGDDDFHMEVGQVNGSAYSNLEETICEGRKAYEEKTTVEMIQNTSQCTMTIDIQEEEVNGGTSQPLGFLGLDVSDYGDKYANVNINGPGASRDTLLGEASYDAFGDNVSDFAAGESIFEDKESKDLLMDTEIETIQQRDELMSVDLSDHEDEMVQESEQSYVPASEPMPACSVVKGRKEKFITMEGEFNFADENAVAVEIDASAQFKEKDAENHFEEVKAAEVHQSNPNDRSCDTTKTADDKTIVPTVKEFDSQNDVENEGILLTAGPQGLSKIVLDNTSEQAQTKAGPPGFSEEIELAGDKDSEDISHEIVGTLQQLNADALLQFTPEEIGECLVEAVADMNYSDRAAIIDDMHDNTRVGETTMNEIDDSEKDKLDLRVSAKVKLSAAASCLNFDLGASNVTLLPTSTVSSSDYVNTPFHGENEVTAENSIRAKRETDATNKANFGSNIEDNIRNCQEVVKQQFIDHEGAVMATTDVCTLNKLLFESENKSIAEGAGEAQGSSNKFNDMVICASTSVELAFSENSSDVLSLNPDIGIDCLAIPPVTASATHEDGASQLQVESQVFSRMEINLFLDCERYEGKEIIPGEDFKEMTKSTTTQNVGEEKLHERCHIEEKLSELNGTDLAASDEPFFEQAKKENAAIITTEECFGCENNMKQSVEGEKSFDQVHNVISTEVADRCGTDCAASDELITEADLMGPEVQIVASDAAEDGAKCEEVREEIEFSEAAPNSNTRMSMKSSAFFDSTIDSGVPAQDTQTVQPSLDSYKRRKPDAKLEESISLYAKQMNSSTMNSRSSLIQGTPEKMLWTVDMKENNPMIKTEQTTMAKSVTKRRALEDIQKKILN